MFSLYRWLVLSAIYGSGNALDALNILTHLILTKTLASIIITISQWRNSKHKKRSLKVTEIIGSRAKDLIPCSFAVMDVNIWRKKNW